jgi:acyl-CoA synthetase (AMP-forming)/AMP-acid ligase II
MASETAAAPVPAHIGSDVADNLIHRLNVGDTLTRSAARHPTRTALVEPGRELTYAELNAEVNRFANGLAARGYRTGDALGLVAGNSIDFLVTYYACAKLGVVCVPVNLGWTTSEVSYVLDHSRARGVVVEAQLLDNVVAALESVPNVREVIVAPGTVTAPPPAAAPDGRVWAPYSDVLAQGSIDEPVALVPNEAALSYLYTSGTTSAPKGVVTPQLAVYVQSLSVALENRLTEHDRLAAFMPLFHCAQLNAFATPAILVGASLYLMRSFDPATVLETVEQQDITIVFALPMMFRTLVEHPDREKRDLSSLRRCVYAMAPMPDHELRTCIDVFKCEFALMFGQTEMSPVTTIFRPEHQLSHSGAVGTPAVNVQVAIMDAAGNLLPQGEAGEIVYRGPHALSGYLRNPEATAEAFAHGWFHSGDVGRFDADGILWFEDRFKDVIKTGGENVASIEVEKALYAAEPKINEVVVIGLPHDRWGEAITAVVVPRPGETIDENELLAKVREQLAGFKAPKAVVQIEQFPRTSTGKVQKNLLRQQLKDLYVAS